MSKDDRYTIADANGMSHEFADWFYDNKKDGCGNIWFIMMCAMWEGWKGAKEQVSPTQKQLRELVDLVWQEATESPEVPATEFADDIISEIFSKDADQAVIKPVADLYQLRFQDGSHMCYHTDLYVAVQWIHTCEGNSVQEYVKLERLQEALTK